MPQVAEWHAYGCSMKCCGLASQWGQRVLDSGASLGGEAVLGGPEQGISGERSGASSFWLGLHSLLPIDAFQ